MLTDKQKKDYIDGDGGGCPYCHSTNIEGSSVTIDAGTAAQEIICLDCLKTWQEVYELTTIIEA